MRPGLDAPAKNKPAQFVATKPASVISCLCSASSFSRNETMSFPARNTGRTAAVVAPLLNLRNSWPVLARLGEAWLGFSARRSLRSEEHTSELQSPDHL